MAVRAGPSYVFGRVAPETLIYSSTSEASPAGYRRVVSAPARWGLRGLRVAVRGLAGCTSVASRVFGSTNDGAVMVVVA